MRTCMFVFKAMVGEECVGAIVCKLDMHKKMFRRGYIAMLAVDSKYRRKGIGKNSLFFVISYFSPIVGITVAVIKISAKPDFQMWWFFCHPCITQSYELPSGLFSCVRITRNAL